MGAVDHVVDRVVGGRLIGDLDGALQAVAEGRRPSVSNVNEIATGMAQALAALAMPTASST